MRIFKNYSKYIKAALLMLFVWYYGCITFFNHTHIINGVAIVHSYPHISLSGNSDSANTNPANTGSGESHTHSTNEIVLIRMLSTFVITLICIYFGLEILLRVIKNSDYFSEESPYRGPLISLCTPLRGPPLYNI